MSYLGELVQVLDHKVKQLRNKTIPSVKILYRSQKFEEATGEPEEEIRKSYPHLFKGMLSFEDETLFKGGRAITSRVS